MNLAWKQRNGGVSMERIDPATLPDRIHRLYRRGLEAVAWLDDHRDEPSGAVERDEYGRLTWWYYEPDTVEAGA